jgi:hypothetical protein
LPVQEVQVGASGWDYLVPYRPEVAEALLDLQAQVFNDGDYYQYWRLFGTPRPETIEDLWAAKETPDFWDVGTHSILDIDKIASVSEPDSPGAIRALSAPEMHAVLGTDRPTRTDFERALPGSDSLLDVPRWSGRYVILYKDERPDEIAFWGYSGD